MNFLRKFDSSLIKKSDSDALIRQYGKWNRKLGQFRRMPAGYFFYITDICNLTCEYCWQRNDGSTPNSSTELSLDEWIKIVDHLPRLSFVGLTGGEATVFKDLNELVEHIKKSHSATINTNGMLLDEKRLEVFVENELDNISISIDGFAEHFDRAREHSGLFDKIVRNIKKLNEIKKEFKKTKPTLTIKTVLLDECVDELEEFYEFCSSELLADNINISFNKTKNHAQFDTRILSEWKDVVGRGEPIMYSYQNREKIVKVLLKLLLKSETNNCKVSLYPQMKTEVEIRKLINHDGVNVYQPCHLPWAQTVVSPVGDVIPCLSLSMGNLRDFDYDIKKIFYADKYNKFLSWLENVNDAEKTASPCNMCCYLRVKSG